MNGKTIKVVRAACTCPSAPSQYQGSTKDGLTVYARYRSGIFRLHAGKTLNGALESDPLLTVRFDPEEKVAMDYEELRALSLPWVRWPSECEPFARGLTPTR